MSNTPGPTPLDPGRPKRATLGELGVIPDADAFFRLALLKLDLLFERDPARRRRIQSQERLLEEVEAMDWPEPAQGRPPSGPLPGAASVELAPEDFRSRPRSSGSWAIRRTGPLPRFPQGTPVRSTGRGQA